MGGYDPLAELIDGANMMRHAIVSVRVAGDFETVRGLLLRLLDIIVEHTQAVIEHGKRQ